MTAHPHQIIKLAIMAVGGQGGGVLTGWIEQMARAEGYLVQATSVAGVSQRTGATIYYIEMAQAQARPPVFSLAPSPGDVDILIAAEMMEAGRAVLRGFVTPDRTTLIASSHRTLAVSEKSVPGDGIADAAEVQAAAEIAAARLLLFDFEKVATDAGSVISASLFGALAGSGVLPFSRAAFEGIIGASAKGAEASLRAFARACDLVEAKPSAIPAASSSKTPAKPPVLGPARSLRDWQTLVQTVEELPTQVQEMTRAGLRRVVDFQDVSYGRDYLNHLQAILRRDTAKQGFALTIEAAKYIANAMAYNDVIHVANLKTRPARFSRIQAEMQVKPGHLMQVTEYMHPGAAEIIGLLPAGMGRWFSTRPKWMARIERVFGKSRRLRSDSLTGFLQLYTLGGLRGWRRRSYRHAIQTQHLNHWLETAFGYLPVHYDLAVEVLRCHRLIKGYSDTHARGLSKFDKVLDGIALLQGRQDAADWARRLRDAALQDEKGQALDGALQTIRSFV